MERQEGIGFAFPTSTLKLLRFTRAWSEDKKAVWVDGNKTMLIWVLTQHTTFYVLSTLAGKCVLNGKIKDENKLFNDPCSLAGHDDSMGET